MQQFKSCYKGITILIFFLIVISFKANPQSDIWVSAYYAGWKQGWYNNGHLPAEEIDYSAITHIIHFALVPNEDGTLNADVNSIREMNSSELISQAHSEGKKILISVGGWNSAKGFRSACSPANLPVFIVNLINFMSSRNYDGIDIDWEPLIEADTELYISLITALRTALDAFSPRPLLTAAVGGRYAPDILSRVHHLFDQINIMTYDYSGAWPGWVTWHNSPVYDGGFVFPSTGRPVPSADNDVNRFIQAGIPPEKLGIGIDFYGYIWSGGNGTPTEGVTKPRQDWSSPPSVKANVPYHTIMDDYYHPDYYHWDDNPKAAYLSIDYPGFADDKFISFDDEKSIREKFDYVRTKKIGGLIIWELGGGYRPNLPTGQKDILLQIVKNSLNNSSEIINNQSPSAFGLEQNYPNPFNAATTIRFNLNNTGYVLLQVFNTIGEKEATLISNTLESGQHSVTWDASHLPSGIYYYRLSTWFGKWSSLTKKMILMK